MRLLHTSDWHLGRLFHGVSLTGDQSHVLEELVRLAREARLDAVLLAGDVYDRAVPPPEAVTLLDEVLSRLILELRLPVVVVAGNHDSVQRLAFGARLLAPRGLHLFATLEEIAPVLLRDAHGTVAVHALPYADPPRVREAWSRWSAGEDGQLELPRVIDDHQQAMAALVARVQTQQVAGARTILVGHAFVAEAWPSESERPLSLGGAGTVAGSCFAGFGYVALGHLHRPQAVGRETLRYSGSLLPYAFSEADHEKSVTLVELDGAGACRVEAVPLAPRRRVRCLAGTMAEILAGPRAGESREDYLQVTLLDRGPVLDAVGRLREVYPNVLEVCRAHLQEAPHPGTSGRGAGEPGRGDELELVRAFVAEVGDGELTAAMEGVLEEAVAAVRRAEREEGAEATGLSAAGGGEGRAAPDVSGADASRTERGDRQGVRGR